MDNQQTNSLIDMGWLAGIIDGEGWLILNEKSQQRNGLSYAPVVGVNCTSQLMINKIQEICQKEGIGTWVGERHFSNHWKNQYVINIRGMMRVEKLLRYIAPYLVLKQPQAELLLDFINYRKQKTVHDSYGTTEKAFRQKLQEMNRKGKVSTTK